MGTRFLSFRSTSYHLNVPVVLSNVSANHICSEAMGHSLSEASGISTISSVFFAFILLRLSERRTTTTSPTSPTSTLSHLSECHDHAAEPVQRLDQLHLQDQQHHRSNKPVQPPPPHTHPKPNSVHHSKVNKARAPVSSARWPAQPRKRRPYNPE